MRIAHRGAPSFAPENTLLSFEKAITLKANYLELDVHQTHDNALIVLHDSDVNRTTNGKGKVLNLTLDEIQKLDAGAYFGKEFKNQHIPTLDTVLELLVLKPELKAIIELKGGDDIYPGMEKRVVEMIKQKKLYSQVIFKAFDPAVLARMKVLCPSVPSLYVFLLSLPFIPLTINTSISFQSPFEVPTQILQSHYYFLTKGFVQEAHSKGYKVVAWGVDSEKHMLKSLEMGVDGIETDRLDLLDQVITQHQISGTK